MTTLPRQSQFRHIFCEEYSTVKSYTGIDPIFSGEGQHIKVNPLYFIVAVPGGGGPFMIHKLSEPGRIVPPYPKINYHEAKVVDFDFSPLHDDIIASSSQDSTIKILKIPENIESDINKETTTLLGHNKVSFLKWHPVADNTLASIESGQDRHIKLWDITTQEDVYSSFDHGSNIFSIEWNYNGSLLATTSQKRELNIFDLRESDDPVGTASTHESGKLARCFWVDDKNMVGSVGMKKSSQREILFFDSRKIADPVHNIALDQQTSFFYPYYDSGNSLLYLAGKGDSGIRIFELTEQEGFCHFLTESRMSSPQKGIAFMPKRVVDVSKPELLQIMRLLKDSVVPCSIQCPRTGAKTVFQEDLYPDCYAGVAALSVDEFMEGKNVDPPLISLRPKDSGGSGRQRRRRQRRRKNADENEENEEAQKKENDEITSPKPQENEPEKKTESGDSTRYKKKIEKLTSKIEELEEKLAESDKTIAENKKLIVRIKELEGLEKMAKKNESKLKRLEDDHKKLRLLENEMELSEKIISDQAAKIEEITKQLADA